MVTTPTYGDHTHLLFIFFIRTTTLNEELGQIEYIFSDKVTTPTKLTNY